MSDKLYHYTNKAGADGIKRTGVIRRSGSANGAGGAFGAGVYFTDLDPHYYFRNEILANNYGGIAASFKTNSDYVVIVNRSSLQQGLLTQNNVDDRHIYCYANEVPVRPNQVFDKPTCRYSPVDIYHYTSTAIAETIKRDGRIRPTDNGQGIGKGVLLTELNPYANYRKEILANNYGKDVPKEYANRADNVVVVDRSKLNKAKLNMVQNIGNRN
ncbi:unnamed protein product, partial [Medioppia subpectinata]